jgi:serine/threonine protein kinase
MSRKETLCPADETWTALIEGRLGASERVSVYEHIDQCETCSLVSAELAGSSDEQASTDSAPAAQDVAEQDWLFKIAFAEPATLPVGLVLAERYRLIRFIGRGGMGQVYEAEDLELHKRVALKTINDDLAADPVMIARLKREVSTAHQVTHPNVCRIFDFGYHRRVGEDGPSLVFITMELLSGESLAQRLERGQFSTEDALPIVRQLTSALAAAHSAGIIHRDLKSDNIMLLNGPEGVRAVITDFGLARTALDGDAQLSSSGALIGTVAYMAPEQALGEPVTPASDIYAFGIVLFEMLTGQLPFAGKSPLATALDRLRREPPSPRALAPEIGAVWDSVILKCLAQSPAHRFRDAQEIVTALNAEEPGIASRRTWRTAAVVSVGGLGLAGLVAVSIFHNGRDRAPSSKPQAPAQSPTVTVERKSIPSSPPPPPPVTAAPRARGTLVIHAEPSSARARLDGNELNLARGAARLELDADMQHTLIVSAPKHKTRREPIVVKAGQVAEQRIVLSPLPAAPRPTSHSDDDDDVVDPYGRSTEDPR